MDKRGAVVVHLHCLRVKNGGILRASRIPLKQQDKLLEKQTSKIMSEMCVVLFIYVNILHEEKFRRTCSKAQNGSFKLCEGARSMEETTAKSMYFPKRKDLIWTTLIKALITTSTTLEKNSRQKSIDKWIEAVLCYELQLVIMNE